MRPFLFGLCLVASAAVDPRYVGSFKLEWTDPKGAWRIDFTVTADGTFTSRTTGPGVAVDEAGAFEAANGRFGWKSAKTPARDAGTYQFDDDGNLIATGAAGITAKWTRMGASAPATRASLIDPAVIGTWTRDITYEGKPYAMYMRMDADAQYRSWAEGASPMNGDAGTVVTENGIINIGRVGTGGLLVAKYRPEGDRLIFELKPRAVKDSLRYESPTNVWRRAPADKVPPSERAPKRTLSEADAKDPAKCFALGSELYEGKELAQAFDWFTRAAELGHSEGQLQAGWHLANGMGVRQDLPRAVEWYGKAIAQGNATAMANLGAMYELGQGVPEDWVEAARHWKMSADKGWVKGIAAMGRAYQFGIGVPQNRDTSIEWNARAAAQGSKDGEYYARVLKLKTNFIGFRDVKEKDFVVQGRLLIGHTLLGGDPHGKLFRNSAERYAWLTTFKQQVDTDETEMRRTLAEHSAEYEQKQKEAKERSEAIQRDLELRGNR
jgi:TPR repeat protein